MFNRAYSFESELTLFADNKVNALLLLSLKFRNNKDISYYIHR